jgi:hypothetical protein
MGLKERRKYPRIRVGWAVSILAAEGSRQGRLEDISLGGAFISCEMPLTLNQKVVLDYGDHSKQMQDIAEVVWTNDESEGSGDKPTGVGVRFLQDLNSQGSTQRS